MAIDLKSVFAGYNPTDYGYSYNNDGSKPGGWYQAGAESASNPYGSGSPFESYLAKNGVGMWDAGNPGYGRVGMTNQQAFNGLYPGAQMLGHGSDFGDQYGGDMQYFTTANGATPNQAFEEANVKGKDFGDHTGINGAMEKFGPMIPLLAAGGMGAFAGLGAGGSGLASLNGGSFLAANDAAMAAAGTSALGTGGMFAGLADGALGGGLAGAGLGGASMGAMEAGLGNYGMSAFGNAATSGLGIDSPTNPFSFDTGPMNNFDGTFGGPSMNGSQSLFNQGNPFDFNSPLTSGADAPMGPPTSAANPATLGTVQPSVPSFSDLAQKYGFDAAKSLYNYVVNQKQARDLQAAGQRNSNVMGQPERQPFLDEAAKIAQGNLGAGGDAIKAAVDAQAQARYAKYGYGGTETSRADTQLAAELAKYGNDRLNALLGYTGANQNTASTAYQATRDSAIFSSMSYQQFSVLAGKIGADAGARGAITQAAKDLGNSIMSFFS